MWSKIKNIESSSQSQNQNSESNSLSSESINLTLESKQKEQKYKQIFEIARIQEDILSRNFPIKMRREYNKITRYEKVIKNIRLELKDLEKLQETELSNSDIKKKTELTQEIKILEPLVKESKERITKIISLKENIDESLKNEEDASLLGELWNKYKKSKSGETV